ncbi:hypothetical protein SprV_0200872600 [Sparganum proliferum]
MLTVARRCTACGQNRQPEERSAETEDGDSRTRTGALKVDIAASLNKANWRSFNNQLFQHLGELPALDYSATVENRWCQLRTAIHSTALDTLGRARRQHQDWFDDNDVDISQLPAKTYRLHKAYMNHRTDANKAVLFQ